MPSVAETARGLRDRPLGRLLIFGVIILAALLVARSCGAADVKITQEQAIAIAKAQIDYTPNNVLVRLNKHGFQSRPFWNVSLSIKQQDGTLTHITVVILDARTGEVTEVRAS